MILLIEQIVLAQHALSLENGFLELHEVRDVDRKAFARRDLVLAFFQRRIDTDIEQIITLEFLDMHPDFLELVLGEAGDELVHAHPPFRQWVLKCFNIR